MTHAAENVPVIKTRKKVLTYDDYVALTPPDSGNYELHNGKIIYIVLFVSKKHLSIIGKKKIEGAPDLVVEILSESNVPKEMSYKKYIYESYLVKEYWLINLKKSTITVYANNDGELLPTGIYKDGDEVKSQVLQGFRI